ncbi:MAG: tRNA 2-thiouridine(34) synthase MnmA, partial [Rhodoferax sp.]|nr:tRNA 2-thiouridine(34) synthase MnmA [Rhodoferax sp.]
NTLWVVQGHDHPWLLSHSLNAQDASWIAGEPPPAGPLSAKTRYRQADAACTLLAPRTDRFALEFGTPQWAVTPGQSAVLYDGDVCLGGGVIGSNGQTA